MTLLLNDDQLMFRDAVRRFVAERLPVNRLRELRDTRDATGFDRATWKDMAEMGCAGVLIPEDYGGTGFGHAGAGLIAQELGRNLSVTPMLSTAIGGVTALLSGGSEAQKQSILSEVAIGDCILALAVDEQSRHAPFNVATQAARNAAGYVLNGRKIHVLDGHVADHLIVSAERPGEGLGLFLLDACASGVHIERVTTVDSHNTAVVMLTDVAVPADALLAAREGSEVLDAALNAGRAFLAAELLGVAEEAFNRTLDYLRQREQFGVLIGSFQALQHRAAHLFCEIELLRSLVLRAAQALDAGEANAPQLACAAKAKACEVSRLATNEAVQMHGGIGMTDEFDIGFFMKRARAASETFGDQYFCADRLARASGY